jgi:hypothetical protein
MPHRKVGPDQPEVRDGFIAENVFPFSAEECAKVVRDDSSQPGHRRPGSKTPENAKPTSATFPDR